jgi:hypothetical protein
VTTTPVREADRYPSSARPTREPSDREHFGTWRSR